MIIKDQFNKKTAEKLSETIRKIKLQDIYDPFAAQRKRFHDEMKNVPDEEYMTRAYTILQDEIKEAFKEGEISMDRHASIHVISGELYFYLQKINIESHKNIKRVIDKYTIYPESNEDKIIKKHLRELQILEKYTAKALVKTDIGMLLNGLCSINTKITKIPTRTGV